MRKNLRANNKNILAIDASRNRSGGARAHLVGILTELDIKQSGFDEVHLWSYKELLDIIPEKKWLVKHSPKQLSKSILSQLYWQRFTFHKELKKINCSILLNTDAGTVSKFLPCVTMSRDMLSYEPGEINRYGLTFARLRLELLKLVQSKSLKRASGAIFLTKHALKVIQKHSGEIKNYALIPHGVGENFRNNQQSIKWPSGSQTPIKCIYVSPTWRFKHQWQVVKAIESLRRDGINITLTLVGGGSGKALKDLNKQISKSDPKKSFVKQIEFVNHDLLPGLLSNSHICIFASSCENMPNSLVEGMASGLPIACSDRGPMPEILKDGGLYFNPENNKSITYAIKSLIHDPILRRELAAKAMKYSEKYSWSKCSKDTWQYLNKISHDYHNKYNSY